MPKQFLRLPEVVDRTGFGKASIYRLIKGGKFPRPVKIGERASGWIAEEVESWAQARINARDSAA